MKIISGGQSGVDRAALDVAAALRLESGGWCPAGRWAEDGVIPNSHPMKETPSVDTRQRTEWNVRDSDATIIIHWGDLEGGTLFTYECCCKLRKPCLLIDMEKAISPQNVVQWITQHRLQILNIASPRESARPGEVYLASRKFLLDVLLRII
ncbi:MAG: molybdenum cofactor carrier [Bdellovibrio sp.]|nr:MAG: molybdenum cofactor carrier [Bdellovibrio sp.]